MGIKKKKGIQRIVLIDTHAVLHRGYHALPDFTTIAGEHTGAIYGLATFLLSIIKELDPDHIIATYDLPGGTFRHEQYEEYKATRGKTDDALIEQFDRSRELYHALGIPVLDAPGFEADDVLGTVAEQLKKRNDVEVIIASGDMDTVQLVDGTKVRVYTLRRGLQDTIVYDKKAVIERFGFAPKYLVDYKGLRGDPSDNIPGIPGIGEKTATTLIGAYGSLDAMYDALKKNRDAFLKKTGLKERIASLLDEHTDAAYFSRELATIRLDAPVTVEITGESWRQHVDGDAINELFTRLEFKSLRPRFNQVLKKIVLDEPSEEELAHEHNVLHNREPIDEKEFARLRIMFWLLHSDRANITQDELLTLLEVDNAGDAKARLLLQLEEVGMAKLWSEIEEPLYPVMQKMQDHGICVDLDRLAQLKKEYTRVLKAQEKKIHDLAGEEFNVNSPKQLGEILFEKLDIPGIKAKKTATGAYSTNASQLEKMRDLHPIAREVLEYREVQKLLSTYIEPLPLLIHTDGRIHAQFDQAGTTTGRFSSRDPNLQNIPTKSELGRAIRTAFVAPKGCVLLALDYSQIELRVAAWLSGDEHMVTAFNEGSDFHAQVAAQVFDVTPHNVTKEQRRAAKVINFGIVYGMGVSALKLNLGVTSAEARDFYDKYKARFSRLFEYFEEVKEFARVNGYTETYYGRRRYAPDIKSHIPFIRAQAERFAMNAPLQGTGADIVKQGMVEVDRAFAREGITDAYMILQVHDEIVLEVKKEALQAVALSAKKALEGVAVDAPVPFLVGVSAGVTWGELTPFEL